MPLLLSNLDKTAALFCLVNFETQSGKKDHHVYQTQDSFIIEIKDR